MKVLYEASNLAFGFEESNGRTGIFRVSSELLERLATSPEIDCALASFSSFIGELKAAEYLQREKPSLLPRLRNVWRNPLHAVREAQNVARGPGGEDAAALRERQHRRQGLNERLILPLTEKFDILHSFHHAFPERDRVDARARVLHVHDVIPLLLPEMVVPATRVQFDEWLASLDVERDWVITISECSKRDLCTHTGIRPERVFVVPNAAATEVFHPQTDEERLQATLRRYGLHDRPYVLALSTLEPRKNLLHLLECFFALCRDGAAGDSRLVLVGPDGWMFESTLERWRREPEFRDRVVFTGYVPDADLSSIYSGARLFVYVSHYEGFGLPPLEAMSCGVPTVTSSTSSLPEVVGEAALLVHPDDAGALYEAMRRLLADDVLHAELAAKSLTRAASFSWERSAQQVIEAYRTICAAA